jgi:carbon-monoxide dehydrogenase medium subunit
MTAQSAKAAAMALAEEPGKSRVLAGGTDLLVQMKAGNLAVDLVVDIKQIPGIRDISAEAGGFRIGAAVANAELREHEAVCKLWPGVVEAAGLIGSTQVQGRCTMAGNLCNGSPAGDSVPALVAADATVRIEGPDGTRDVPVLDIPAGPGKTTLTKAEIVTSILLPARAARSGDADLRFIPRTEMDIAVASAAVSLTLDASGTVTAAPWPWGPWRRRFCWSTRLPRRSSAPSWMMRHSHLSAKPARPPATRSTTNAAPSNSAPAPRASLPAVRPRSPMTAPMARPTPENPNEKPSRIHHHQRRPGRVHL